MKIGEVLFERYKQKGSLGKLDENNSAKDGCSSE